MTPDQQHREIRWRHLSRAIPTCARTIIDSIDVTGIRNDAAEEVERTLFGWEDRRVAFNGRSIRVDPGRACATWNRALNTNRAAVMTVVRRIVDEHKRVAQKAKLQNREIGTELLAQHFDPHLQDGVLVVRPALRRHPYFGIAGYLEATPVEIPVYVARLWQRRTGRSGPNVWDPTAGSNTAAEVLRVIFGARVVASDIVATDTLDEFGPMAALGLLPSHRQKSIAHETHSADRVISTPDIVFLDPPSRGRPTHSALYSDDPLPVTDLASLDRMTYLAEILTAAVRAVQRLAPDGLVSVLLRAAERDHQRVTTDPQLVTDFADAMSEFSEARLVERFRVTEPVPVNQASLGTTRHPMTHLLYERAS